MDAPAAESWRGPIGEREGLAPACREMTGGGCSHQLLARANNIRGVRRTSAGHVREGPWAPRQVRGLLIASKPPPSDCEPPRDRAAAAVLARVVSPRGGQSPALGPDRE